MKPIPKSLFLGLLGLTVFSIALVLVYHLPTLFLLPLGLVLLQLVYMALARKVV